MRSTDYRRLIGLAVLLVLAGVVPQIPQVGANVGLTLDGKGFGSKIGSKTVGSCVLSQTLTTTKEPDVIVGLLVVNDTTTSVASVSDNESLTWIPRASKAGSSDVQIFVYYSIASRLLSADNITFVLSSGAVATVCQEFGISGADTSAPFDPNPLMPNASGDTGTTNSVTYNTYNPNDFLIILQGFCAEGAAGSGSPLGFTTIVGSSNAHVTPSNCASNSLQSNTYYERVSAIQSSTTISWAFDNLNSPVAIMGDAIQSTPGPLSASVITGSNVVDVGQSASFSCTGTGGIYPYTYSWNFGDGSAGSGASTSHDYSSPGTVTVFCTVTDTLGTTAKDSTEVIVITDPSVTTFTASPANPSLGEKVTFTVSASGGYGTLSYSYTNLPAGCLSANATSLSCYPTRSRNYRVTVIVTDHAGESANATVGMAVGPQRVLGLPLGVGVAVIFGTTVGIGVIAILSITLAVRRKKRRQTSNSI